jgi:hypothetical protein
VQRPNRRVIIIILIWAGHDFRHQNRVLTYLYRGGFGLLGLSSGGSSGLGRSRSGLGIGVNVTKGNADFDGLALLSVPLGDHTGMGGEDIDGDLVGLNAGNAFVGLNEITNF